MVTKRDYYEVLEISRTAEAAEIKSAYRKLARKFHPDVNPGDPTAEEQFKEVQEAYEILSDDQKRQVYDRFGHDGPGGAGGFAGAAGFGGFGDIFDLFFNGAGGSGRGGRSAALRGQDIQFGVTVTLEEAYRGVERTIRVPRIETCAGCQGSGAAPGTQPETCPTCKGAGQVRHVQQTILGAMQQVATCPQCGGRGKTVRTPCPDCQGRGQVRRTHEVKITVPAGVDTDMQMPLRGEGNAGQFGGPPGDLYLVFQIEDHPEFDRRGRDLFTEMPISFTQATLGDEVTITLLGGEEATITVPEGTQTGTEFRLRGRGMPDVLRSSGQRGDVHVAARVQVPTRLTDEEKRLLRQFADLRGEKAVQEQHKGFFERVKEAVLGHDE
jgi:molecular chaperone DnaJ